MKPAAARPQRRDLWMPCHDGVRLASRVWSPPGEGPWPLLLMRQPYGRAIASTVTYAHPRWYAERGFVVVVQDVRGRGDSEGEFGGFAQEAIDGATAVRWCRSLVDCNGRVGSYGFSYQGLSQLLNGEDEGETASAGAHDGEPETTGSISSDPLPDCLAPAMCGADERLHWASEGGAHWWSLGLAWALQLAAEGARRRHDAQGWRRIRRSLESGTYLEEGLELLAQLDPGGMGLGWLGRDPSDPDGWRRHRLNDALLRRPMLLIGGWHDPHLAGVLDLHARSLRAGGQPGLVVGAWSHLDWQGGIDALQLAFFRRHLGCRSSSGKEAEALGAASGDPIAATSPCIAEPQPVQTEARIEASGDGLESRLQAQTAPLTTLDGMALQCTRSGRWWRNAELDPRCSLGWNLASDGLAAIRSDEGRLLPRPGPAATGGGSGGLTLVHDPWRPVPSRGGHLGPAPGLAQRGDLDGRSDVACFQTPPLTEPLRLLGRPLLRITVAADQPGFDLWAGLSVVEPDGQVLQLSTGLRRVLGPQALDPTLLELQLQPLAASLKAGERLRLSLAAAAWPAFAVNPGNGSLPRGGSDPDHRVISLDLELQDARLWLEPLLTPQIGAN